MKKLITLLLACLSLNAGAQVIDFSDYDKHVRLNESVYAVYKDGLLGFVKSNGEIISDCIYFNSRERFTNNHIAVANDKMWGFVSTSGNLIDLSKYEYAGNVNNHGFIRVKQKNYFGFVDTTGKEILPPIYSHFDYLTNGYYAIEQNELVGMVDSNLNVVIKPTHDYIKKVNNNYISIKDGKKVCLADFTGKIIIPAQYDAIYSLNDNLFRAYHYDKVGVVDINNKPIVDIIYDEVKVINDNIIELKTKNLYGFYNISSNVLVKPTFTYLRYLSGGAFAARSSDPNNQKYALLDLNGKQITEFAYKFIAEIEKDLYLLSDRRNVIANSKKVLSEEYENVQSFYCKRAKVYSNSKYGYINDKGELAIPAIFQWADDFRNSVAIVKNEGGKYFCINLKGKPITEPIYDKITNYDRNGMIKVYIGDKCGVIDTLGKLIIPIEFDDINGIYSDLALVKLTVKRENMPDLVGFGTPKGVAIQPKYDKVEVGSFDQKIYKVAIGDKYGFVDENGKEIWPVEFDQIERYSDFIRARKGNKWKLLDYSGKQVSKTDFDDVMPYSKNSILVENDGKFSFINKNGETISPLYDKVRHDKNDLFKVLPNGQDWIYVQVNENSVEPVKIIKPFSKPVSKEI